MFKYKILSGDYIQVDESFIPMMGDEKHKTKNGYE